MYELGRPFGETRVPPGTNLLVVGPPLSGKRRLGYELLAHGVQQEEGALVVTNTDRATRIREEFGPAVADAPGPVGIIDCVTTHQGGSPDSDSIQYVSSPEDMTGVGIGVSEFLEEFHGERGIERNRVLLSSLSALLHYSNIQTVFRFLHVFTSRVESVDGIGLYLLEEGVHEDQTLGTLNQLFGGVVRTAHDAPPEFASVPPGTEQ